VPEITITEHGELACAKDDIRLAWERPDVLSIATPSPPKFTAEQRFVVGVYSLGAAFCG
jgi:hypothetical protein